MTAGLMDKFNPRPSRATRRKRLVWAMVAFAIPTAAFALLFLFGSRLDFMAGFKGLGLVYLVTIALSVIFGLRQGFRIYRQWIEKLGFQPIQGPGFTTLELAVFGELEKALTEETPAIRRFLSQAEVISRFNSGNGCITRIRSNQLQPVPKASDIILFFRLVRLAGPTGCRVWTDDADVIDIVEFFTGSVDTRSFDWATADFELIDPPEHLRPPTIRPISTVPHPSYNKVLFTDLPVEEPRRAVRVEA